MTLAWCEMRARSSACACGSQVPLVLTVLFGYGEVAGVLPPMVRYAKAAARPACSRCGSCRSRSDRDERHLITYLRLLDAESDGADWREVAKVVLKIDPHKEPLRAKRVWESHLSRAKWISKSGFAHLPRGGAPH